MAKAPKLLIAALVGVIAACGGVQGGDGFSWPGDPPGRPVVNMVGQVMLVATELTPAAPAP